MGNTFRIMKIGNCSNDTSERNVVLDINEIFSTVTVGTHGYRISNIIINDRGFVNKSPQISYGICPTLRAENHGNLPKVIINENIQNSKVRENGICKEDS